MTAWNVNKVLSAIHEVEIVGRRRRFDLCFLPAEDTRDTPAMFRGMTTTLARQASRGLSTSSSLRYVHQHIFNIFYFLLFTRKCVTFLVNT